nr:hypothetical protein [bacterium]
DEVNKNREIFEKEVEKLSSEINAVNDIIDTISLQTTKKEKEWSKYYLSIVNDEKTPQHIKDKLDKEDDMKMDEFNKFCEETSNIDDMIFNYTNGLIGGKIIPGEWKNGVLIFEDSSVKPYTKQQFIDDSVKSAKKNIIEDIKSPGSIIWHILYYYTILYFIYSLIFMGIFYYFFRKRKIKFKPIIINALITALIFIFCYIMLFLIYWIFGTRIISSDKLQRVFAIFEYFSHYFIFVYLYLLYKYFKKYSEKKE